MIFQCELFPVKEKLLRLNDKTMYLKYKIVAIQNEDTFLSCKHKIQLCNSLLINLLIKGKYVTKNTS